MEPFGWLVPVIYIIAINVIGFASMGIDKRRAKKGQWRIKENTLFLIAIIGGSIGSNIGMQVFRHKTKHKQFVLGMPAILAFQVFLCVYCIYKLG